MSNSEINPEEEKVTRGVKTLRGDPRKAIIKLSGPMMLAMFVQTAYNLVDAIWVSGLGADSLAAVGLFFPFMMFLMGFSNGLGIGGGSAVSRRIGEKNKQDADNTAIHTVILTAGVSLFLTVLFLPFMGKIYTWMGAKGDINRMATDYSTVILGGLVFLFFTNMGNSLLRSEGDAKRAMYAIILGSVLNIILDPIFIYILDLKVVGAAWATLVSIVITGIIIFYWIFLRRDTYLDIRFRLFKPSKRIVGEILRVGLPSSLSMISMSIAMYLLNIILIKSAGTNAVAVFTTGWRVVSIGTIPVMGIATGVTSVTAAAYGAREPAKLKIGYFYGIFLAVLIETTVAVFSFLFAGPISGIFTYAEGAKVIKVELISFLRWMAPLYPFIPMGMLTAAMFQGIGKGERAFIVTFVRTIVLQVLISYFFSIVLDYGFLGVLWGVLIGNGVAVIVSFIWANLTLKKLFYILKPDLVPSFEK
ncbi:MAG: MATE family efflux transporter [Spirochaetes bacterium]|nr:MAG: MATE family efflux transporter [Spirochaetota bacterium]